MNSTQLHRIFIIAAVMTFMSITSVHSLPKDWEVKNGSADIIVNDKTMTISAAESTTIIDFSSFDISEDESVFVNLPSVDSRILNRVTGGTRTELLGILESNGIFVLVNEAGIHVGQNAKITAGSLILSTRDIKNSDFINGDYVFSKLSDDQLDVLLLNEGKITIRKGGFGVLIGGAVENTGFVIAPFGRIVIAGCNAIRLGMSADGLISVAIDEKTASTILDYNGNPITNQIKNTGTLQADGGKVILRAENIIDVFEKAIKLEGVVKSDRMDISGAGVVNMVASGDIDINADITAYSVEARSDTNVTVNSDITADGGDVLLAADNDNNGTGEFTQNADVISTTGDGNVIIDGSGTMTLKELKTENGAIKIGTVITPDAIAGEPSFVHTEGDIEINNVTADDNVTVLETSRGDVMRYATDGKVTLESEKGSIKDLTKTDIPADYLKIVSSDIDINSAAITTHILNNTGDITIEDAIAISETVVALEGDGLGRVAYVKTNNITLEAPKGDVNTASGVVIPGNEVKLSAQKIGSYSNPVGINADTTYINRIQGDIDISEMWGLGSTLMIRGPAPDSWGAIEVNTSSNLTLEAQNVYISANVTSLDDLSVYAGGDAIISGNISVDGDVSITGSKVGQFGTLHADGVSGDGGNITLYASNVVALSSSSLTTANAGIEGNGGKITVYSPDTALFWQGARIEAKGGQTSGNGGFVEVSGLSHVEVYGSVDTSAPFGKNGLFFIDPYDITIQNAGPNSNINGATPFVSSGNSAILTVATLQAALLLGDVTVQTGAGGAQNGDLTVADTIDFDGVSGNTLTLSAHNNLNVNASITDSNPGTIETLNITLTADSDNSGSGTLTIAAAVNSFGGDITLTGADIALTAGVNAGAGTINLYTSDPTRTMGIGTPNGYDWNLAGAERPNLDGAATLVFGKAATQSGGITFSNNDFTDVAGLSSLQVNTTTIVTLDSNAISAGSANITITGNQGISAANATDSNAEIQTTGTIQLTTTGTGNVGSSANRIQFVNDQDDINVTTASGNVFLGTKTGVSENITLGVIESSGAGNIDVTATGNLTAGGNISTAGGDIDLEADSDASGSGTFTVNNGVSIGTGAGAGDITFILAGGLTFNNNADTIAAGTGTISFESSTGTSTIGVGGDWVPSKDIQISDDELATIASASKIAFGRSTAQQSGNIFFQTVTSPVASVEIEVNTSGSVSLDDDSGSGMAISTGDEGTGTITISANSGITAVNGANANDDLRAGTINLTTNGGNVGESTANPVFVKYGGGANTITVNMNTSGGNLYVATGDNISGTIATSNGIVDLRAPAGDSSMTVSGSVNSGSGTMTITATQSLTISANLTSSNGTIDISARDNDFTQNAVSTIASSGGSISITAGDAVSLSGITQSSGGTIAISGAGDVTIDATIESATGNITLTADSDGGGSGSGTLTLDVTADIDTGGVSGSITLKGADVALTSAVGTLKAGTGANDAVNFYTSLTALTMGVGGIDKDYDVSDNELQTIGSAGKIVFGESTAAQSGNIFFQTVTSPIAAAEIEINTSGTVNLANDYGGNPGIALSAGSGTVDINANGGISSTTGDAGYASISTTGQVQLDTTGANAIGNDINRILFASGQDDIVVGQDAGSSVGDVYLGTVAGGESNLTLGAITSAAGAYTIDVAASGNLTIGGAITSGGNNGVLLYADSDGDGAGGGTLTLNANVTSAGNGDVELGGADISINSALTALGSTGGTVNFFTSSPSVTIEIGGAGAANYNISDDELSEITAAGVRIRFGESGNQSGSITFITVSSPIAATNIEANTSGIVYLDDNGTSAALATGGAGNITIAADGGISASRANNAFAEFATTGQITINTAGANNIGSSSNSVQFPSDQDEVTISTATGNIYVGSVGTGNSNLTLGAVVTTGGSLFAGATGNLTIAGAISTGGGQIGIRADRDTSGAGTLNVNANLDSGGGAISLIGADVSINASLTVLTAGAGAINFYGSGGNRSMEIGGAGAANYNISDDELSEITGAATIRFGQAGSQNSDITFVTATSPIAATSIEANTAGTVYLDDNGTSTALATGGAGNITIAADGGISASRATAALLDELSTTGAITLTTSNNDVGSSANRIDIVSGYSGELVITTAGGSVYLNGHGALNISTTNTGAGNLDIASKGTLTDSGALTISGTATLFTGNTNDIVLNNAANNFGTVVVTSGKNVTLVDANSLFLDSSVIFGDLSVTASGTIGQTTGSTVVGSATFAAGAGNDITLSNATNDFASVLITSGRDVTLTDVNAITLGASTVSRDLTVISAGDSTIAGALSVTGNLTFTANNTNVTSNLTLGADSLFTINGDLEINTPGIALDASSGTIDLNGNLSLLQGTLGAPSGNFNISGSFSNGGGTFTHNSGTVIFDTAAASTITGSTTFGNFTSVTSGKTLTFQDANTQTIAGTLTLIDQNLNSVSSGFTWSIDPQGTINISGPMSIQDSVNLRSSAIYTKKIGTVTGTVIYDANNTVIFSSDLPSFTNCANWLETQYIEESESGTTQQQTTAVRETTSPVNQPTASAPENNITNAGSSNIVNTSGATSTRGAATGGTGDEPGGGPTPPADDERKNETAEDEGSAQAQTEKEATSGDTAKAGESSPSDSNIIDQLVAQLGESHEKAWEFLAKDTKNFAAAMTDSKAMDLHLQVNAKVTEGAVYAYSLTDTTQRATVRINRSVRIAGAKVRLN